MNAKLLGQLKSDVDSALPREGGGIVLAFPSNPAAPIVSIIRSSGVGAHAVPVFFIAAQDEERLLSFGSTLYQRTNRVAAIWHMYPGKQLVEFMIVPVLYHKVSIKDFINAMTTVLSEGANTFEMAAFCENCEVLIRHGDVSYTALTGSSGELRVKERDEANKHG